MDTTCLCCGGGADCPCEFAEYETGVGQRTFCVPHRRSVAAAPKSQCSCEEQEAQIRVIVTDLKDEVLSDERLCLDCANYKDKTGTASAEFSIGSGRRKQ